MSALWLLLQLLQEPLLAQIQTERRTVVDASGFLSCADVYSLWRLNTCTCNSNMTVPVSLGESTAIWDR